MTLVKAIRVVKKVVLAQVLLLSTVSVSLASSSYQVSAVDFSQNETGVQLVVKGGTPPTYTIYELFDPQRVILDIADATFASGLTLPISVNKGPLGQITGRVIDDKEPSIAKLEIFLAEDAAYTVDRKGNDILINFAKNATTEEVSAMENSILPVNEPKGEKTVDETSQIQSKGSEEAAPKQDKQDLVADLLESIAKPQEGVLDKQLKRAGVESDEFAAAGFKKQKISVDFYKIDLHNVFRLFGEISGANLIIDQGVSGTLTLALNEVPWDFALDIILNLKDLQKEERYNTIVISKKKFVWPEAPERALDIKAPPTDVKIAIEQRLEMPAGMLEAKKIMHRANLIENEGNIEKALELYEQAFLKWPENADLARQISSFCLVDLGLNAKALHYAKIALKIDAEDKPAALLAAIASANMKKDEAGNYFQFATSGERPSQEALVSYASYAEQKGQFEEALASLVKHTDIYGDSLETMIAKARIHDKGGNKVEAVREYQTILYSGFELDADLERFIKARIGQAKE